MDFEPSSDILTADHQPLKSVNPDMCPGGFSAMVEACCRQQLEPRHAMSDLLAKAPHLKAWPLPPWLAAAIKELGQAEVSGAKSNPRLLAYRRAAGIALGGDDGVVPWCAIFINAMLSSANVMGTGSAMARSFASSGHFIRLKEPVVGCITVISSNRGAASGHVFFYTAENGLFFQALGGNQNDQVSIAMFQKKRLVGHYWPKGIPLPPAPYNKPVRLARPLLPHEKKAARDA